MALNMKHFYKYELIVMIGSVLKGKSAVWQKWEAKDLSSQITKSTKSDFNEVVRLMVFIGVLWKAQTMQMSNLL